MTTPHHEEAITASLNELRNRSSSFQETMAELQSISEKATTKNKQIEATVDSTGRLTGLTIRGDRWREMAPNELSQKITEVVNRAQDKAVAKLNEKMMGFLPGGMNLETMQKELPDMDAIIEDAIKSVQKWSK